MNAFDRTLIYFLLFYAAFVLSLAKADTGKIISLISEECVYNDGM